MILAFTGTRAGMKPIQKTLLTVAITQKKPKIFCHGDAIGADEEAHRIAFDLVNAIYIFPPINPKYRAYCSHSRQDDHIFPEEDYIVRDHHMVDWSDELIATPKHEVEELRSGTWATIRYARKQEMQITIIFPNGRIVVEKGKQRLSSVFGQ